MTTLIYVLYAVAWFGLGVIVGAQWTRMRRDVRRLANDQAGEKAVAPHEELPEVQPQPARVRRWSRRVLDTFVVLLFIGSAVQAYVTYDQIQGVVECQKGYQAGWADAFDARQTASAAERAALITWMKTLDELITRTPSGADPNVGRQRFAAATSEYLQRQAELTRKQQENPYPPSPRDVCD